jgi:hypothetical protein
MTRYLHYLCIYIFTLQQVSRTATVHGLVFAIVPSAYRGFNPTKTLTQNGRGEM